MRSFCDFFWRTSWACAVLLGTTLAVQAQSGSPDITFKADTGPGEVGFSLAVQPDGKVLAVGTFGVRRFLSDGTADPAFELFLRQAAPFAGPGRGVGAVALQPDGRILVTGDFIDPAGAPLPRLMRLHSDGRMDTSFAADARVVPSGHVLMLQPDGKIVTDGDYARDEEDVGSLIRLLPDGSLDPDWSAHWYRSTDQLFALALSPGGQIYFATFTGIFRTQPDGSRDDSFNPELRVGPWGALAVQPDGKLLVGQYSDGPGPSPLRRLLADGTDDPSWSGPQLNGGDAVIYAISIQPDGKVLVGGNNLEAFDGVPNAHLGRVNADGSVDRTFDTRGDLYYYSVEDLALAPDGKVIVAGYQLERPSYSVGPGVWRLSNDPQLQPRLEVVLTQPDGVFITLRGLPGARYRLEYREELSRDGGWISLTELTLDGGEASYLDSGWRNSAGRFYRATSVR
jgi:uncharacterized delta-60 repeat protein